MEWALAKINEGKQNLERMPLLTRYDDIEEVKALKPIINTYILNRDAYFEALDQFQTVLAFEETFYCKNCGAEVLLDELGLFHWGYNDSVCHFCPCCGWNEFYTWQEVDTDADLKAQCKKTFETKEHKVYPYPVPILKLPPDNWNAIHKCRMAHQRDKQLRELRQLKRDLEALGAEKPKEVDS
jgi:hypothetical protein